MRKPSNLNTAKETTYPDNGMSGFDTECRRC